MHKVFNIMHGMGFAGCLWGYFCHLDQAVEQLVRGEPLLVGGGLPVQVHQRPLAPARHSECYYYPAHLSVL